jgi:hypothetical protein
MIYLFLAASCITFIELFIVLDVKKSATALISGTRDAQRVFASSEMSDDEKERYMRRETISMFKATAVFLFKFVLIFAALYALFRVATEFRPELEPGVVHSFTSPIVIVALTAAAMFYVWLRNVIVK